MSQKKKRGERERKRIPALSGSIETPPTMSFQPELKLHHYIIPKTSLWLIIPWELGTDAARRVMDAAAGCKFTLLGSSVGEQTEGLPWTAFKTLPCPETGDRWGHRRLGWCPHHPTLVPCGATAELPRLQLFLTAGGSGTCWSWQGQGEDVIYTSEQIHVLDKPRNPEACKSIKQAIPTVSLAQVSWLKQESPSGKQGISSCTGNISKALLLLSK